MITNNNTSPAADAAPATEPGLTTLDPGAGYITTMNTYTVAPERVEERETTSQSERRAV